MTSVVVVASIARGTSQSHTHVLYGGSCVGCKLAVLVAFCESCRGGMNVLPSIAAF